ncbi:phage tail tape measure protein [Pseudomonas aeruginosa]|jgi:lambda family phage tail tape measure protein|uniref:phage tail tape measure protein n=1 Tax=Pseudomonas aeruginosa TaxID=287 RepID=UPI00053E0993|nr:phage tail tape measure protein [Pseudomonas aeruginosa]MBG4609271.1 phage tail tape measure protein [Pseudomonas aeruginosa]MBG5776083.1 phage tail tape measure protein [Pseudomonas aeruginosa]MBV5779998.1 phage tail tape measure protein [Pseudomonas aeruginosa]MBV6067928.1 phage tail tape measure protein [Pseudomonas aeruginosa]MBV6080941.1 phage tail tape measure protein [Pseudomonas aeruginosa]
MASRSLGTLTLDLIAKVGGFVAGMDAAERRSEKWRKEVEKNAAKVGAAIGAATAAGITALAALTVSTVRNANEIANLASVANASTTEFQKYAAGAKLVGIEQEKLADIFKDVNDKVGDFLNTGGGALADFFENVAPKIGVTADQFRNLSGPQALGLYVSSLEKAKVSQSDMTFYLEAIASDATALLPLLRNNAEGFKTFGDAAQAAGAILDEKTIKSASELQAATWLVEQSTTGLKNQLTSALIPVLSDFATKLLDVSKDGTSMVAVGEFLVTTLKLVAGAAVATVGAFQLVGKSIAGAAAVASSAFEGITWLEIASGPAGWAKRFVQNLDGVKASTSVFAEDMVGSGKKIVEVLEFIGNAGTGDVNGRVKELAKLLDDLRKKNKTGTFEALGKEAQAAAKKLQSAYETVEQSYQRQIALINTEVDKRKDATEVAKLQFEIESGKLVGINAEQQKRLNGLAEELDRLKQLKQANEDAAKAQAFRATLNESNATARAGFAIELAGSGSGDKLRERLRADLEIQQDYNKQLADLQKQFNSAEISKELYDQETDLLRQALAERLEIQHEYYAAQDEAQSNWLDGVTSAWENYRDTATDYQQQAADFTTQTLDGLTSAVGDGIASMIMDGESLADVFKNIAQTMATSIINALAQMAAQWLVYQAVQLVTGKAAQASAASTLVANAQATAFQAQLAAFASTAAIPIVGPVLAPAAAASAAIATAPMVAGVAASALAGMAHDGIDAVPETGTWLLQKGERVTTAETSAKLDRTLDDVRSNQGQGGNTTVNIVENKARAGQVERRRDGRQEFLEVFVADINGDGPASRAIAQAFGIRRSGT